MTSTSPDAAPDARPLRDWAFGGTLRKYQADVLERVDVRQDEPLHIVAPPGSGKTLLGLLLAVERGRRTLVLAPTVTIREQWAAQALQLAPGAASVSQDPLDAADLTALTYQVLSVLDSAQPLAGLALARWAEELVADGRSPEAATAWLEDLRESNPRALREGITRRSRRVRRELTRQDPAALLAALHPNAQELIARLVSHDVDTIVLDECHHLLDHWALVVAALAAQLRAAGRHPLLIGLTATLPSPDDADQYDNYTSLLGEVDYEVPPPAVVREGNLAPNLHLVRFCEPTTEEVAFMRGHAAALDEIVREAFTTETGLDYLVTRLQPGGPPPSDDPLVPPPAPESVDTKLSRAFAADVAGTESAAQMVHAVAPQHPLIAALPESVRRAPDTDQALRLLARFALDEILPDPQRAAQWERVRRVLADFGYTLTDRGVRRGRDPIDTVLASSLAKDQAACDVLAEERRALGDAQLRALVVTDFATHGNRHGGLVGQAGALRTFDVIASDPGTRGLRGVLVTGDLTRVTTEGADAVARAFERELGVPVTHSRLDGSGQVSTLHAPGSTCGQRVLAASALLGSGELHVVVGTRGLFGEGWDCPAVNTLIDLTTVATAASTQQLRGRSLRLDPAWPRKVAHNWTITAVTPPSVGLQAQPDVARLRRKYAKAWGLDRDDASRVVRGLNVALSTAEQQSLDDGRVPRPVAAPPRSLTYEQWQIGTPYDDSEFVVAALRRPAGPVFRTTRAATARLGAALAGGVAVAVLALAAAFLLGGHPVAIAAAVFGGGLIARWAVPVGAQWRLLRRHTDPDELFKRIADVVWEGLRRGERVADTDPPPMIVRSSEVGSAGGGSASVGAAVGSAARRRGVARATASVSITCPDATRADQRTLATALAEMFGAVGTPRFVLQTGRGGNKLAAWLTGRAGEDHVIAVPTIIGRRRSDAQAFAADWDKKIGPAVLHEVDTAEALELVAAARRAASRGTVVRDEWS